eukprot:scaffold65183_cov94-Phaeocystis_antarctica.AAC.1
MPISRWRCREAAKGPLMFVLNPSQSTTHYPLRARCACFSGPLKLDRPHVFWGHWARAPTARCSACSLRDEIHSEIISGSIAHPQWRYPPLNVEALQRRRLRDCFGPCQVAVQYIFASVARARPRALPARRECRSKAARVRHLMVEIGSVSGMQQQR